MKKANETNPSPLVCGKSAHWTVVVRQEEVLDISDGDKTRK